MGGCGLFIFVCVVCSNDTITSAGYAQTKVCLFLMMEIHFCCSPSAEGIVSRLHPLVGFRSRFISACRSEGSLFRYRGGSKRNPPDNFRHISIRTALLLC